MNKDVKTFDRAFTNHVGHSIRNKMRAFLLSITRGRIAASPVGGHAAKYWRKLVWASASFAFLSDVALIGLGGMLKRKEKITGRFADIFSWLYLAAATLRRYEAEGRRKEDRPYFDWSMEYAFGQIQEAFDSLYKNFDVPFIGWIFKGPVALWSRVNTYSSGPSDRVGHAVARLMQTPGEQRQRLSEGMYAPESSQEALGRLERAFRLAYHGDNVAKKITRAVRAGTLEKGRPERLVGKALSAGIINEEEANLIRDAEAARYDAIQVDSFTLDEFMKGSVSPEPFEAGGDGVPAL